MCNFSEPKLTTEKDPAVILATLIYPDSTRISQEGAHHLRELIRDKWGTICKLVHAIHDQETSEERRLDRAISNIAALDADGIKNVIKGTAHSDFPRDFELVAKAVLKQK